MQAYQLIPHPAYAPLEVSQVEVRVHTDNLNWLRLRWRIDGSSKLVLPRITGKRRADGLWQATCFEMFLREPGQQRYCEWNLSPSRQWNAYDFSSVREGMVERVVVREPDCVIHPGSSFALFDAAIPWASLPKGECEVALTAVIEEAGGRLSYWALAHGSVEKPDFHDPACFTATLAAPLRA